MPFDATDPDTKAAIDKIKADAAETMDTEVSGLKSKIDDLIKKLKKGQDIDPAEVERVEAERDDLRTKLAAATKQSKEATTALDKATKALEGEQIVTHRLIAENGLVAELTKAGVTDPAYLDAVKALHISSVKVVADGDDRKAFYGDKPLADAIKEWAGTDIGKRFVAAPNNSGGGATGGKGGESGKTVDQAGFDALSTKARAEFFATGGKIDQAA